MRRALPALPAIVGRVVGLGLVGGVALACGNYPPSQRSTAADSPSGPATPNASGSAAGAVSGVQGAVELFRGSQSGYREPAELAIRDQAAWEQTWLTLHRGDAPAAPAVDFAQQMVILVALGERSTGGWSVAIDGISAAGGEARVAYTVTRPGPDCMSAQVITAPAVAVRVPRATGAVRFERKTVASPC